MHPLENDAQLVLVGSIHRDPGGYQRLFHLLENQHPDLITVEISPYSIRFRKKHQEELFRKFAAAEDRITCVKKRHPALHLIDETLKIPYEWRAAWAYSRSHKIPCLAIDVSWIARRHLSLLASDLLSKDNLEVLCQEEETDLEVQIRRQYTHARKVINLPDQYAFLYRRCFEDSLDLLREKALAKRIRVLCQKGGRLVHIGGWIHLIEYNGFKSLACLLRDLEPQKILLNAALAERDSSA